MKPALAFSQPMLQRMRSEVEAAQEQVTRSRFEPKDRMSREEWRKAFSLR